MEPLPFGFKLDEEEELPAGFVLDDALPEGFKLDDEPSRYEPAAIWDRFTGFMDRASGHALDLNPFDFIGDEVTANYKKFGGNPAWGERLGRDVRSLPESLGPLGAVDFVPVLGARVPRAAVDDLPSPTIAPDVPPPKPIVEEPPIASPEAYGAFDETAPLPEGFTLDEAPVNPWKVLDEPKATPDPMGRQGVEDPTDVFTYVRKLGGIKDDGGDLASMGLDKVQGIVKPNGMDLDSLRARMIEDGYLQGDLPNMPPTSSIDDVKDLLSERLRSGSAAKGVKSQKLSDTLRDEQLNQAADAVEARIQEVYPARSLLPREREAAAQMADELDVDTILERLDTMEPPLVRPEGMPTKLGQGSDKDFNIKNIWGPDDAKQTIYDIAHANQERFMEARRGVQSWEKTAELGQFLNLTPAKLAKRLRGEAGNAETIDATIELLKTTESEFKVSARRAFESGSDADKLQFIEDFTRLQTVVEHAGGYAAEAGRALNIFRKVRGVEKIKATIEEASKTGNLDELIKKAAALDNAPPGVAAKFVDKSFRAKTVDVIREIFYNSILSGLRTQVVNTAGNAGMIGLSLAEHGVAAGISKFTGSGIRFGEGGAALRGIGRGAMDGLYAAAKSFMTEEPIWAGSSSLDSISNLKSQKAIPGLTGKIVRTPSRVLLAVDELFKAINYRKRVSELAYRKASSEGLKGDAFKKRVDELETFTLDNSEIMKDAHQYAEKQTFTNPLGPIGSAMMALRNKIPGAWAMVPFVRTPTNVVTSTLKRSPAAFLFSDVRAELAKGGAARDEALAKIAVGTAISAGAVAMVKGWIDSGIEITGAKSKDPAQEGARYLTGDYQPLSIKINGTHYSYARFEPFATFIGTAVDFVRLGEEAQRTKKGKQTLMDIGSLMIGSVQQNITSKIWFESVNQLFEAWRDPTMNLEKVAGRIGSGFAVPNILNQAGQSMDPFLREANSLFDQILSKVPPNPWTPNRTDLPIRRDDFGKQIQTGGALGPDVLSPIFKSEAKPNAAGIELERLGIVLNRLDKDIRGAELSAADYDKLQEVSGGAIERNILKTMQSPIYQRADDESKREMLSRTMTRARKEGRGLVIKSSEDIRNKLHEVAAAKKLRLNALQP
jgi:hypothetical protein